ncbi:hypothetical protein ANN_12369 [Periplaneta americana]|uniref:Major facilitator superfamily (MFS) profile domain-containing protein n=1 Tax=Periplaneta americana TaxID=6978 RepID=A0ABQ8TII0_PERAM|nr:hypothetical protein ANN_12369 [Periplaneta americana]
MTWCGSERNAFDRLGKSFRIGETSTFPYRDVWRPQKSRVVTQVLASIACNFVLLDLNLSLAYPTILIAQLAWLEPAQASWLGSIAYICQPVGSLCSGVLVEWLGRKRFMLLLNLPFLLGWVLMATAPSYAVLCLACVIVGITIGLTEAPINSYIGEVCRPGLRGNMTACAGQGPMAGLCEGGNEPPGFLKAGNHYRRHFCHCWVLLQVPEAPIWLVSKGRIQDAEKALCWLRGWVEPSAVKEELSDLVRYHEETKLLLSSSPPKIQGQTAYVNSAFVAETGAETKDSQTVVTVTEPTGGGRECCGRRIETLDRIRDLLRPPTLRPLLLVIPFFFFVHFSGLTSIRPFMVHVFEKFHMPISGEWATVVSGGCGIVGTVFMMCSVQRLGKRPLSLACTAGSALSALLLATYALVTGTPIVGQMPWMLLSEVFPFRTRGLSGGVSAAGCYVFLFLSSKTFLDMERDLQLYGAFFFYGTISCIGVVFLYFRLLETEGKSLEEIERHFTEGRSAWRRM